jgi:hypothetical protein
VGSLANLPEGTAEQDQPQGSSCINSLLCNYLPRDVFNQIVQEFYQRKSKQQSEKKKEDGNDAKEGNLIDA